MKAKNRYHHGELKTALVEAGIKIIDKHGITGLTLQKAAKAHNVSAAAVYRHYGSKEELLAAIAAQGYNLLEEAMSDILARKFSNAETFLQESMLTYVDFARQKPRHYELMFGGFITDHQKFSHLSAAAQSSFNSLLEIIKRCQQLGLFEPRSRPLLLAFHVWSLLHGYVTLHNSGQNPFPVKNERQFRQLTRRIINLMRHGLHTRKA